MYFTREDILKILKALLLLGIKDSEFKTAQLPLLEDDTITIVQNNVNRKVKISNIIGQFNILNRQDFINVSDMYDEHYITISEAIKLLPERKRKAGLVITFQNTNGDWQIYLFEGTVDLFINDSYWKDLFDFKYPIIDSVLPDEEDLTLTYPDNSNNSFIKLKDKEYNLDNFSGLGKVILRKNIVEVKDPTYGKIKKNILYQDMINKTNTIYVIQYDFILGEDITIPANCVLLFDGGSISGGYTVTGQNTIIKGTNLPSQITCSLDGTFVNERGRQLDKMYKKFRKCNTIVTVSIAGSAKTATKAHLQELVTKYKQSYVHELVICLYIYVDVDTGTGHLEPFCNTTNYSEIVNILKNLGLPIFAIKIHTSGPNTPICWHYYQLQTYMNVYEPILTNLINGLNSAGLHDVTDRIFIMNENYLCYSDYSVPSTKATVESMLAHIKELGYKAGIAGFGTWTLKTPLANVDMVDNHYYIAPNPQNIGFKGYFKELPNLDFSDIYKAQGQDVEVDILESGTTGHTIGLRYGGDDYSNMGSNGFWTPFDVKYYYWRAFLPIVFKMNVNCVSLWYCDPTNASYYYTQFFTREDGLKKIMEDLYYE